MGYTTYFTGEFSITPPLTKEQTTYLDKFAITRRVKRNPSLIMEDDPERLAVDLPLGIEGEYYVGGKGYYGQDRTPDVIDDNQPPATQPGLWCQWVPNEDGTALMWDGGEKFYRYTEWIQYLVNHFFDPWGRILNGEVHWEGERNGDMGKIIIENNEVIIKRAVISYRNVY